MNSRNQSETTYFFRLMADYGNGSLSGRQTVDELSSLLNRVTGRLNKLTRYSYLYTRQNLTLLKMVICYKRREIMDDYLMNLKLIEMEVEESADK